MTPIAPAPHNSQVPTHTPGPLLGPLHAEVEEAQRPSEDTPILLLFSSYTSGQSRRMDGFVAHVLQRRHNHRTFRYRIVLREQRPDLFERFRVDTVPTLVVIDGKRVRRRLVGYHRPGAVERLLAPWLH